MLHFLLILSMFLVSAMFTFDVGPDMDLVSENGTACTHPMVRKEWIVLSMQEQGHWIDAVKCLANLPHDDDLLPLAMPDDIAPVNASGSYYDDIVYMHMDLNHQIHFTGLFLPWHRWYIHAYETALRTKCGYIGVSPYWDWTQDTSDFLVPSMFTNADPQNGLGGWGDPSNDFQLTDGAFSSSSSFQLSYPSPHSLRRNFTLQPYLNYRRPEFITDPTLQANVGFTKLEIEKTVTGFVGDFKGFQTYLEAIQGAHGAIHNIVGGDLQGQCPSNAPFGCVGGPTFAPNEPLFWMHHAMVDKVWYDWQNAHESNAFAFEGGVAARLVNLTDFEKYPTGGPPWLSLDDAMPAEGMFPEAKISDVMSTTAGYLCYVYL